MSNSGSGILVPPGHYPPFAVVTESDHTAWIIIAAALGLCWVLLFTAIRVFIRPSRHGLDLDEYAIAASTVSFSTCGYTFCLTATIVGCASEHRY
jgi:hypothetical protein